MEPIKVYEMRFKVIIDNEGKHLICGLDRLERGNFYPDVSDISIIATKLQEAQEELNKSNK